MSLILRPYAAIAIAHAVSVEQDRFLRLVAQSLARQDMAGGGEPKVSLKHGAVASDRLIVKLTTQVSPGAGGRIVFRIAPRANAEALPMDRTVEILSDIVLKALQRVDARHVEWLDPRTKLSPEEFQISCSYVSPKRQRREMADTPESTQSTEDIEKSLARMFEDIPVVSEPGHGEERQAEVARRRAAARRDIEARAPQVFDEDQVDEFQDADFARIAAIAEKAEAREAEEAGEAPRRRSLLRSLAAALPLRTFGHMLALGGVAVVFWKNGLFDPLLNIIGS
ncbi:hypothetical protein [Roseivivax sp.]